VLGCHGNPSQLMGQDVKVLNQEVEWGSSAIYHPPVAETVLAAGKGIGSTVGLRTHNACTVCVCVCVCVCVQYV